MPFVPVTPALDAWPCSARAVLKFPITAVNAPPCLEHPAPAPKPLIHPSLGADPVLDYHLRFVR